MDLSRRQLLSNSLFGAGALALSPILNQVQAQASGRILPPRFVFVLEGNGLPWRQITPLDIEREKNEKRTINTSLVEMKLPESLEPIKPFQNRLNVINGLSGKISGMGHSVDFGALGVYNCGSGVGSNGTPQGETVDVALGTYLGGIFQHVCLGILGNEKPQNVVYNCSARGRSQPVATICQPMAAYASLFGSVAGGSSKAAFNAKTNLLDFLMDDVKQLEREVPASERHKLAAHLHGYEDMRNRQSRLGEIEGTLIKTAPELTDKFTSAVECDRLDAQFDIGAAALIGGLTNSLTIASGVGNQYFGIKFTGLGIDHGKHNIGHGQSYKGMTANEMAVKIRKFHFQLIHDFMQKLDAVPEGDGTMLDNTVILYLSDAAEGHHCRCWQWPFVMIPGKNTGIVGGRYIEYPYHGNQGHREHGNLYTTLLHAAGDRREYFGLHDPTLNGNAHSDGPLPELLA